MDKQNKQDSNGKITIFLTIIALAIIGGLVYHNLQLRADMNNLTASTTAEIAKLNDRLTKLGDEKERIEEANRNLRESLNEKEEYFNNVQESLGDLTSDIDVIKKVQNTDPELLKKYSKVFFLNENYFPADLKSIPEKYLADKKDDEFFHEKAWPFLEEMLEDAEDDDVELRVISAYRNFDEQSTLKGHYTVTYGAGTANQFSADQGYSEHQLGTTVDFSTPDLGTGFTRIDETEAYEWLLDNAYKYGFVLSYPEGNDYYQFEPWHWRFVGKDLARDLNRRDMHFYDMEQREIDEYRAELFED